MLHVAIRFVRHICCIICDIRYRKIPTSANDPRSHSRNDMVLKISIIFYSNYMSVVYYFCDSETLVENRIFLSYTYLTPQLSVSLSDFAYNDWRARTRKT